MDRDELMTAIQLYVYAKRGNRDEDTSHENHDGHTNGSSRDETEENNGL